MQIKDRLNALKAKIKLPVISAPMFLVSGTDMVVEACKAGIIGSFPGQNSRTIEDLRRWFNIIDDELTSDDAPWAFNMITHSSYGRFDQEIALVSEFKPNLVITALGGPHRVTDAVHGYGGLVFADVNNIKYARKALDKGADGLVLVCSGAGGHTGEYAMMPFIEEVRQFFDGPLIVGGGISTGVAVRAVETLGADFAYIGTRFLAAKETLINDDYRNMVIECHMDDLIASRAITGALGNWMKPSLSAGGLNLDDMKTESKIDFSGDMHSGVKAWKHVWSAGQGGGAVTKSETMKSIIDDLITSYLATIDKQMKSTGFIAAK